MEILGRIIHPYQYYFHPARNVDFVVFFRAALMTVAEDFLDEKEGINKKSRLTIVTMVD
jgi:hypothetical protein